MAGLTINSTQNVDLGSTQTVTGAKTMQNLIVTTNPLNLTVGQIAFPATQNASADANTLDDYEEGTFTPTIRGTGTAGTGTYSVQSGKYTKIGNRVYFQLYVSWTNLTGQTGTLAVGNLPFTSEATANNLASIYIGDVSNLTWTTNYVIGGYVSNNTNYIIMTQSISGVSSAAVAVDTSGSLLISGHYEV